MGNFVHLHVHDERSELDGLSKTEELFQVAHEMGQTALAITNHGNMGSSWVAQCVADKVGIKAIHGIEFYYERENDGKNGHLIALAKSNKGLETLFALHKASQHNFYRKPRITFEMLQEHHEDIVVSSACLASTFSQYLIEGSVSEARAWARKYKDLFGEDFYLEIQPNQIPEQYVVNDLTIKLARELDIEIIATNDVHYTYETDSFNHEVLLAIQSKKKMSDEKRFKFDTNDYWLKSEEEMINTFDKIPQDVVLEAIANTSKVADKCNARIEKGHYLPRFYDIPEGETERSLLVKKTKEGLKYRGFDKDKAYIKEVQDEIDIIDRNGYSGYFLIVQDYVNDAKKRKEIVGDGRGSGAGSKVSWLTRISELPPQDYDLLFERFMADGREPDFDVDFSNQTAIFRDLQHKYGVDNVARIIAYGTLKPRAVIRKVLTAFEFEMPVINSITKLVPELCEKMEDAYASSPELITYRDKYRMEFNVIERLAGIVSHTSQHAGGVIIYPDLAKYVPLKWDRENEIYVACWDKVMLADLGHFKFDILGLETVQVIYDVIKSIYEATGEEIDLYNIDYEAPEVYDMLCKGHVSGVFQIAEQGKKVTEQQPRNFRDLIAINALIRPGVGDWQEYLARRGGKKYDTYSKRNGYMDETNHVMTYQEQFLLDCKQYAGWSIAYGDKHIRKKADTSEEMKQKFISDSLARGYEREEVEFVWNEIASSVGGYSFNKSHSASYARMTYQTAYLKCFYPQFFYASLMSHEKTDGEGQSNVAKYIQECKQRGINILPPNINTSTDRFTPEHNGISYRITTIKHVGESAIKHIEKLRPINGFTDFLNRRSTTHAKANVIVNLIKAGAFDFDNPNRAELLWQFDMSNRNKTQIKNDYQCPPYTWNEKVKREWEKEVLGMYLTSHPMERYGFKPLSAFQDESQCRQGGEVTSILLKNDKNGNEMAFITLDTLHGSVRVLLFSSKWNASAKQIFQQGNLVLVRGKRSGDSVLYDSGEVLEGGE